MNTYFKFQLTEADYIKESDSHYRVCKIKLDTPGYK